MLNYSPPFQKSWTGRSTPSNQAPQYWYQLVQCWDATLASIPAADVALLGYACDEGVRRNQGRVGAVKGPDAIRQRCGKLAAHFGEITIIDAGNIHCPDGDLKATQQAFGQQVSRLIKAGILPIGLGGGHDIAYANFSGIRQTVAADAKIGIINFDAHFDLRPVVDTPNSGTPFNQILQEEGERVHYLALGIQQPANTQELFEIAKKHRVEYLLMPDFTLAAARKKILALADQVDHIYLTIDLDGFSSAYAPGVSAPSPMGFSPQLVLECLAIIFASGKVISCDLAELNPALDRDNSTANLAARLIEFIVQQVK